MAKKFKIKNKNTEKMKIYVDSITPERVTVLYNSEKRDLMYLIDGKPHHGFVGTMADKKFMEALDRGFNIQLIAKKMDTQAKIRQFHAILAKKGIMDLKHDILAEYGVISTKDLKETQLDELINRMQTVQVSQELRDARSIVLDMLNKIGITGSKITGWDKVNEYLLQPRIAGKQLYEMNSDELKACSLRLRSIIYKSH